MKPALWVRRARPFVWAAAALGLVTILVWQVSAWSPSPQSTAQSAGYGDSTEPGVDIYPPGEREEVPALEGTTLDGDPLAISDWKGDIVVINVWGSWCAPCRAETPDLVRLANETKDRGVRFLGVDTRDSISSAQAFVKKFDVPYPSLFDDGGQTLLSFREVIPTAVIPSTVVVDRQGRVAARIIGPVTYNTLNGLLQDEIGRNRS
jgi:thiol-disulfide isomerase/thioredoxin